MIVCMRRCVCAVDGFNVSDKIWWQRLGGSARAASRLAIPHDLSLLASFGILWCGLWRTVADSYSNSSGSDCGVDWGLVAAV